MAFITPDCGCKKRDFLSRSSHSSPEIWSIIYLNLIIQLILRYFRWSHLDGNVDYAHCYDDIMVWNPSRIITGSFDGIHRSAMSSYKKGQIMRSSDVSFLSSWTCCLINSRVGDDLRMVIRDEKFTLGIAFPHMKIHHNQHYSCHFSRTTMLKMQIKLAINVMIICTDKSHRTTREPYIYWPPLVKYCYSISITKLT